MRSIFDLNAQVKRRIRSTEVHKYGFEIDPLPGVFKWIMEYEKWIMEYEYYVMSGWVDGWNIKVWTHKLAFAHFLFCHELILGHHFGIAHLIIILVIRFD